MVATHITLVPTDSIHALKNILHYKAAHWLQTSLPGFSKAWLKKFSCQTLDDVLLEECLTGYDNEDTNARRYVYSRAQSVAIHSGKSYSEKKRECTTLTIGNTKVDIYDDLDKDIILRNLNSAMDALTPELKSVINYMMIDRQAPGPFFWTTEQPDDYYITARDIATTALWTETAAKYPNVMYRVFIKAHTRPLVAEKISILAEKGFISEKARTILQDKAFYDISRATPEKNP